MGLTILMQGWLDKWIINETFTRPYQMTQKRPLTKPDAPSGQTLSKLMSETNPQFKWDRAYSYAKYERNNNKLPRSNPSKTSGQETVSGKRLCHCISAPDKVKVRNTVSPNKWNLKSGSQHHLHRNSPEGILHLNSDDYTSELWEEHHRALMKDTIENWDKWPHKPCLWVGNTSLSHVSSLRSIDPMLNQWTSQRAVLWLSTDRL